MEQFAADQYELARAAKGKLSIARAWRYAAGPRLPEGRRWIAVDIDLAGLPLDTDDLELADAESSATFAVGDVRRLDRDGNVVGFAGASARDSSFVLMFDALETVQRVTVRYRGETLTAPIEIAAQGPVFAEPQRVRSWENAAAAPVTLVNQRHAVHRLDLAGELVIASTPQDVLVLDTTGAVRARLGGAPDGPSDIATAAGTLVVSEPFLREERGRIRIWRAPQP